MGSGFDGFSVDLDFFAFFYLKFFHLQLLKMDHKVKFLVLFE